MTQYYFIHDGKKQGPFSKEILSRKRLSAQTLVWFHTLENWTPLSDIPELSEIGYADPVEGKKPLFQTVMVCIAIVIVVFQFWPRLGGNDFFPAPSGSNDSSRDLYKKISSSAFDSDVDFDMYLEKFYRDARYMGVFPVKPKTTIIKFAPLDKIKGLTHIHGVSFGVDDDEKIEIYINPSTWETFNKPMRYVLMYHELAHDVLNLRDLDASKSNEARLLMSPELADYRSFTMDEFIESYQTLFAEYEPGSL